MKSKTATEFREDFERTVNSTIDIQPYHWQMPADLAEELFYHYDGNVAYAASCFTALRQKYCAKRGGRKLRRNYIIRSMLDRDPSDHPIKDEDFPFLSLFFKLPKD